MISDIALSAAQNATTPHGDPLNTLTRYTATSGIGPPVNRFAPV
jgi:hypothetical protein